MKIDCQLDYRTILKNTAQPVHLVVKLTADALTHQRATPLAFCVVLDRSGSMEGKPIEYAKKACETAVKNLRVDDYFALVAFEGEARVIVPLQKVGSKSKLIERIQEIEAGGGTNLTGGWMLGREELLKAAAGVKRRSFLLTDGQLNVGIIDHAHVRSIVGSGVEKDQIRTTTLGFGDGYEENLLRELAKCSGGEFYDADSPEKLPVIFQNELEGLQKLSAQNVRVRMRGLDFCEEVSLLSDYTISSLAGGVDEVAVGDLVSEEDRVLVFVVNVLPLPLLNGLPVTTLEGEKLLKIDCLWDEIGEKEIKSCQHEQTIRISAAQDPAEVTLNEEVVAWIAVQSAGRAVDEAAKEVSFSNIEAARARINRALEGLRRYGLDARVADGVRLLEEFLHQLEGGEMSARAAKAAFYSSSYYRKSNSRSSWTGPAESRPDFSQAPSVEEQLEKTTFPRGEGVRPPAKGFGIFPFKKPTKPKKPGTTSDASGKTGDSSLPPPPPKPPTSSSGISKSK